MKNTVSYVPMKKGNNLKKQKRRQVIIAFIMLMFLMFEPDTYTTYYFIPQNVSFFLLMAAVCALFLFFKLNKKPDRPHITATTLIVFILFVGLLLLSKLIHFDNSNYYYSLILYITLALSFCLVVSLRDFIISYLSIMKFLSAFSIISTYTIILFPRFLTKVLPSFEHYGAQYYQGKITFSSAIFCNVYIPSYGMQYRNYGIFREPGVYQFYLLLALVLELFYNKKPNTKSILLLSLALLSTFSAPGIILMLVVLLYYFLFIKKLYGVRKIGLLLGMITITIFLFQIPAFQESLLSIPKKLSGGSSWDSRYGSLVGYINAWLSKPIFGWGYTEGVLGGGSEALRAYTQDNTNTTFTNFALFGLIYGFLHLYGIIKFSFINRTIGFQNLVISIVLLISINTQRFLESPIIFMLIFYACNEMRKQSYTTIEVQS